MVLNNILLVGDFWDLFYLEDKVKKNFPLSKVNCAFFSEDALFLTEQRKYDLILCECSVKDLDKLERGIGINGKNHFLVCYQRYSYDDYPSILEFYKEVDDRMRANLRRQSELCSKV